MPSNSIFLPHSVVSCDLCPHLENETGDFVPKHAFSEVYNLEPIPLSQTVQFVVECYFVNPAKVYIRDTGRQVMGVPFKHKDAESSMRNNSSLCEPKHLLIGEATITVLYFYSLCPHLWEGNRAGIYCCENDDSLIYGGLCSQVGTRQLPQKGSLGNIFLSLSKNILIFV